MQPVYRGLTAQQQDALVQEALRAEEPCPAVQQERHRSFIRGFCWGIMGSLCGVWLGLTIGWHLWGR